MAIIHCLACGKRVSSRAKNCQHCGAPVAEKDEAAMERIVRTQRARRARQLQYISFFALTAFLMGTIMYWYSLDTPESWQNKLGAGLLALGFVSYAVVRVYMLIKKRSQ